VADPALVAELSAAGRLEDSRRWVDALRSRGNGREVAVDWLRAHLNRVALFELRRRRLTRDGVQQDEAAWRVRDAGEAAVAAVLSDLGLYHGQSAFATWTAKYAIREAAARARERG
jgi:hypothetical protein